MKGAPKFEIFLTCPPGLELALKAEALEAGFKKSKATPGGVVFRGNWQDVWRANLHLRGASRVLARIGTFRSTHLSHLEKLMQAFDWAKVLRPDVPVRVEASCIRSKIYHEGAVVQRVSDAITQVLGTPVTPEASLRVMVRIEADEGTISVDTSGEALHKRGYKAAVGKAPMRENMAALFLRQCGYQGDEPVLDPMCGAGTFVIEAAEMAMGLPPGRARAFAFEDLVGFDPKVWAEMREGHLPGTTTHTFFGSDRDAGAVQNGMHNAERAGVADCTRFTHHAISDLNRPDGPPGLVIVNPPYGARIGDKRGLFGLYAALGQTLAQRFTGWRVGVVTTDASLIKATGLPFGAPGPVVAHGGLKIRLWQTEPLR